ncbi:unnamed protein product [Porites evermanni]|uniref:PAC domain-containing protein n=1 Tax=Porites evermanni TaxID=104178 RepID=A0ABN8MKB2_9CNID|nr:unnamed protein product [Porites evermanni]
MEVVEDLTDYKELEEQLRKEITDEGRFVRIEDRQDSGVLTDQIISSLSHGKYMMNWRGTIVLKDPLSLTINQQLLWELKPQTVIEFGAYKGGSALWTADMLKIFECQSRVISIDIDLSLLDATARSSPHVEFIEGDLFQVEKCLPEEFLKNLSHPWLLVEDAHVNMIGVLEYLNKFMQPGDYICVEDTNPLTPMMGGQGLVKELGYGLYGPTKMNTLRNFLMDHPGKYLVDTRYTDMFG